ncbi:uncharacterized protein LOC128217936 [Mya arenaria]|uniref:uncharacterized protein LOC128217936 n=1 Tax=Mya arenaria TaxID=6604 RepID=UPI0022E4FFB3|nr:uncharacterized protein LOC128217936 [Mya arenaria]
MSASEATAEFVTSEEIFPQQSPPGRRRKRTIMAQVRPDIYGDEQHNGTEMPDHISGENRQNSNGPTTCPEIQITPDTPIDENSESLALKTLINNMPNSYDQDDDSNQHIEALTKIADTNDEVFIEEDENLPQPHEAEHTADTEKRLRLENNQTVTHQKHQIDKDLPTDIIYDETKPRRLANPKNLKINTDRHKERVLHDSIGFLISPDGPEEGASPDRRRRKTFIAEEPSEGCDRRQDEVPVKRAHSEDYRRHYERSPEQQRRRLSPSPSSPVQRLIEQKSRKFSSDARLSPSSASLEMRTTGPRRKISSDARLQRTRSAEFIAVQDTPRTRKVSFDTTTLINGSRYPLNDEIRQSVCEEPEYYSDENTNNNVITYENGTRPKRVSLKQITSDKDEGLGTEDGDSPGAIERTTSELSISDVEEGYASGIDNRAYVADDEDSLKGVHLDSHSPPPTYQEAADRPVRRLSPAPIRVPVYDQPAIIQHTMVNPTQKISSVSLPASFGTRRGSSDTPPKSILKQRPSDNESVVSEDSVAGHQFKVRKDSIALFVDQHGTAAMQELRKQYGVRHWRCFGKNNLKHMWSERKRLVEKYKLHLLVLFLFLLTLTFVVVGLHFHSEHHEYVQSAQKVFFDGKKRVLTLGDSAGLDTFSGALGLDIPSWKNPTHCYPDYAQILDKTCLKWREHGRLDISHFVVNNTQCYNVTWNMQHGTAPFDCYNIGSGYWYGPGNRSESQWPIRHDGFRFTVNRAKHHGSGTFTSAIEYYWISSNGEAVVVDSNYPLEISWNRRRVGAFCIIGKDTGDFYHHDDMYLKTFKYTVCNGVNIRDTHSFIRKTYFPTVTAMPERSFLQYPHWSTVWDADDFQLNESVIQNVATSLIRNKLNCSSLELDGKWESNFGDFTFSQHHFKNLTNLTTSIKQTNCDMSLNLYPFFSFRSVNFQEGLNKDYFVKDFGGSVPALLRWEHGVGVMLDVSNPIAREWYMSKIRTIAEKYDIKTFRFAYGTSSWIPHKPVFHIDEMNPNQLKQMFSDMVSTLGNSIVESTSQSQHISHLIALPSSIVETHGQKCLKNIIPDILNLGLMGYPFVMSDGFDVDHDDEDDIARYPSRELYIRWMQLSAFLPAMRYTIKPWHYDVGVVEISRNLTIFHSTVVMDAIYGMQGRILAGEPVMEPLWWRKRADDATFTVGDQFVLADTYLVAPIFCEAVERNEAVRDIYVPGGVWKDVNKDKIVLGPRWLRGYKVSLTQIPFFERMPQY